MAELSEYNIDIAALRRMYEEWRDGVTKSELERKYLDAPQSHGKLFTTLVREHLGLETERRSKQTDRLEELEQEVRRLRSILSRHGIDDRRAE